MVEFGQRGSRPQNQGWKQAIDHCRLLGSRIVHCRLRPNNIEPAQVSLSRLPSLRACPNGEGEQGGTMSSDFIVSDQSSELSRCNACSGHSAVGNPAIFSLLLGAVHGGVRVVY